jgi:hypothetical protein
MYETCGLRDSGDSYFGLLGLTQCNLIGRPRRFGVICCPPYQTYTLKTDAACVLWNIRPRLPEYTSLGWSNYNLSVSITTVTEQVDAVANTPEVLFSNVDRKTDRSEAFSGFLQSVQANTAIIPRLGYNRFLPNPLTLCALPLVFNSI